MKTCHLYARVSTTEQDTAAQLLALHRAAKAYPDHAAAVTEDTSSGAKPWRERGLAAILHKAKAGDVLIVPEMSRIGRSTSDVLDFLAHAAEQKLTVRVDKSGLTIGDDMPSKIISTVLALAAEIERDFLRSRTREGIANARANGKRIGRPTGPAATHPLDQHRDIIATFLKMPLTKSAICKLVPCTRRQLNTHIDRTKKGIIK